MGKYKDITGMKFGRLTPIKPTGEVGHGQTTKWICKCECGATTIQDGARLRNGSSQSCGCLQRELASKRLKKRITKHGYSNTRLYHIWVGMKNRCSCENNTNYACYGARGITVCNEWTDDFERFKEWALKNGYNDDLTIDRIDVNKGYSPENCRFATRHEQALNRRTTHIVSYQGENKTLYEWSKIFRINVDTLRSRIFEQKWSVERAFTTPVKERKGKQE